MTNFTVLVFSLLIVSSFSQFSSFVPSYLLKVPTEFITPVPVTQPLDAYVSFKTRKINN